MIADAEQIIDKGHKRTNYSPGNKRGYNSRIFIYCRLGWELLVKALYIKISVSDISEFAKIPY